MSSWDSRSPTSAAVAKDLAVPVPPQPFSVGIVKRHYRCAAIGGMHSIRDGLPVRSRDRQLQPAGEQPAVRCADGVVGCTVLGDGQHDGDRPVAIRPDGDLPPDVLAPLQPPRLDHLAPRHRERVVPQGLVAEPVRGRFAEMKLEGEGVAVMLRRGLFRPRRKRAWAWDQAWAAAVVGPGRGPGPEEPGRWTGVCRRRCRWLPDCRSRW